MAVTVNMGPAPSSCMWTAVASVLAMTRGMKDRDFEFEQQQFDGENHAGDRGVEGGRHAGRGAARQQHFAFRRGGVKAPGPPAIRQRRRFE